MIDPKKNGNRTLRVRYDSGAIFVGPAIITDEGDTLVLLGGASSLLVRRADGSLPLHVAAVETPPEDDGPCLDAALAVFDETIEDGGGRRTAMSCAIRAYDERNPGHPTLFVDLCNDRSFERMVRKTGGRAFRLDSQDEGREIDPLSFADHDFSREAARSGKPLIRIDPVKGGPIAVYLPDGSIRVGDEMDFLLRDEADARTSTNKPNPGKPARNPEGAEVSRISDGEAMIPIISAHYGFAAAGSPAAFPRSRRIQQIQEPAADVPSPTGFGYGQGLHEKNHVRIEPAGGGADGGAHAAIRVDGLDAVKRTGMSDTNVGQQPGDKSFVINAIGLSHGPERVSGQFRVPCGIVSSHGLDSRTHTHADWNHASNDGTGKGKSNERNKA